MGENMLDIVNVKQYDEGVEYGQKKTPERSVRI